MMTEMIAVAKTFGVRPSSLIKGLSGYAAYCFDVAASIYVAYLQEGKKPLELEEDATKWL